MDAPEHFLAIPIINAGGNVLYTAYINLLAIATIEPWNNALQGRQTRIRNQNNRSYRVLGDHNFWVDEANEQFALLEPALILEVLEAMARLRKFEK